MKINKKLNLNPTYLILILSAILITASHIDYYLRKNKRVDDKKIIKGKVERVVNGDSFKINKFNIRLHGIDAPNLKQICEKNNKETYNCGLIAKQFLESLVLNKTIVCIEKTKDKYNRIIAVCKVNELDRNSINEKLVKSGWAVAYYSKDYNNIEEKAKQNKKGLWQGYFERPSKLRRIKYNSKKRLDVKK